MHLPPFYKLDPQQRAFLDKVSAAVRNSNNSFHNQWIQGFAGSGKSVLLVYAAAIILANKPDSKIFFVVFTRSLVEMFKADLKELDLVPVTLKEYNLELTKKEIKAPKVLIDTYFAFMSGNQPNPPYDYILCDEVQDLTPQILQEMKNRGTHVIVAGDSNQSIYDRDPKWGAKTVNPSEIGHLIDGEIFELTINHRLSRSIIDAVQHLLPNISLQGKVDTTKSDTQIRLCEASSEVKEVAYIMGQATKAVNVGDTAAILIPTAQKIIHFVNLALSHAGKPIWKETTNQYERPDFGAMNAFLEENDMKMQYIGNGYGSFSENDHRIILMTYHSAKGLDFENVFIPFVNNNLYICDQDRAKTLFMVAMTRARKNLYISYSGCPNDYLDAFKSNCFHIDVSTSEVSQPIITTGNNDKNNNPWGF